MADDNVFEGLTPLKTDQKDSINFQGVPIHSGTHECFMCHKIFDHSLMAYTTEPKLCVGCYYDL